VDKGVLDTTNELLGRLPCDHLAVGLARATQHDPEQVGAFAFALGPDDRRPFAEVHLRLGPRLALHPHERRRRAAPQLPHEPLDRLVVAGKAAFRLQVLPDALCRQALFQTLNNRRPPWLALATSPRRPGPHNGGI